MMVMPVAVAATPSDPLAALVVEPAVAVPARVLLLLLGLRLQLWEDRRCADEPRPWYEASYYTSYSSWHEASYYSSNYSSWSPG